MPLEIDQNQGRVTQQGIPLEILKRKEIKNMSEKEREKLKQDADLMMDGAYEVSSDELAPGTLLRLIDGKPYLSIPILPENQKSGLKDVSFEVEMEASRSRVSQTSTSGEKREDFAWDQSIITHLNIPLGSLEIQSTTTAGIFGQFQKGELEAGILVSGLTAIHKFKIFPGKTIVSFQAGKTFLPDGAKNQALIFVGQALPLKLRFSMFQFMGLVKSRNAWVMRSINDHLSIGGGVHSRHGGGMRVRVFVGNHTLELTYFFGDKFVNFADAPEFR